VRVPTGVGVCLIGLLGLLSGCGDGPVASMPPGTVPPGSHDRSASERGLLPAAATLDIRLQLSRSHAAAGNPIPGRLIITNSGQTPVNLTSRRYGCRPKYGIVLTSRQVFPNATFTTDCKTGPFLIPPGRSTLPVVVQTTYASCQGPGGQSTRHLPACGAQGQIPPLPAGAYQAVLIGTGLALPDPPKITVDISPA